MAKEILSEEFQRMQKLAGLINEQQLELDFDPNAIKLTPEQKEEFDEEINDFIYTTNWDFAYKQSGNILAKILTDYKAKSWKDVQEYGYNPKEVRDLGRKLAEEFYDS